MTLLIHPGFHKTATTWLQQVVFSDDRRFRSLLSHEEISDILLLPREHAFDPDEARSLIEAKRHSQRPGIPDVISGEILSGNIMSGSRERFLAADRIAALNLPAKILLTVRAQVPIANSIYKQYVKRGGRLGLRDFLTFKQEPGYFWFDPGALNFDELARYYAQSFGEQNVLVLPQELLKKDRSKFLRLLFDFAGVETDHADDDLKTAPAAGVSPPASGLAIIRFANTFRPSVFNPSPPSLMNHFGHALQSVGYRWKIGQREAEQKMKREIKELLEGRFRESNAKLQQFAPVDLGSLGYEMPRD